MPHVSLKGKLRTPSGSEAYILAETRGKREDK